MTTRSAIKPCPFEHERKTHPQLLKLARMRDDAQEYRVECFDCGTIGPVTESPAEAVAGWNARSGVAELVNRLTRGKM